jgi:hypothetical protein
MVVEMLTTGIYIHWNVCMVNGDEINCVSETNIQAHGMDNGYVSKDNRARSAAPLRASLFDVSMAYVKFRNI